MSSSDLFASDWEAYLLTRDCLKVTKRAIGRNVGWLHKTEFATAPAYEAQRRIDERIRDLENYVILAMWTRFERYLVDYLQGRMRSLANQSPPALMSLLQDRVIEAIEFWRLGDTLSVFKGIVDDQRLSDAKSIMKYRDWVVHQNPNRGTPGKPDPASVRTILSDIVEAIRRADSTAP